MGAAFFFTAPLGDGADITDDWGINIAGKEKTRLRQMIGEYGIKDLNDVHELVKMLTAETMRRLLTPSLTANSGCAYPDCKGACAAVIVSFCGATRPVPAISDKEQNKGNYGGERKRQGIKKPAFLHSPKFDRAMKIRLKNEGVAV